MATKKLVPHHSFILCKEVPSASQIGSIIVPEMAKEKTNVGIVMECGPEAEPLPAGTKIFFPLHSEYRLVFNNERVLMVKSEDIVGSEQESEE